MHFLLATLVERKARRLKTVEHVPGNLRSHVLGH